MIYNTRTYYTILYSTTLYGRSSKAHASDLLPDPWGFEFLHAWNSLDTCWFTMGLLGIRLWTGDPQFEIMSRPAP